MDVYAALSDLTDRFLELLRDLGQSDAARPVPGLQWTVGECAAHVLSSFRRMTVDRRRAANPAALARLNAESNAEIGDDLADIAEQIDQLHRIVRDHTPLVLSGRRFPFHAGLQVTHEQACAVTVGELAVHGADVARATGRRWPLTAADVEPVWEHAISLMIGWLRPEAAEVDETWRFVAPDSSARALWRHGLILDLHHGELSTHRGSGTTDHTVVVADPVALTLTFPYQRRPATSPELARLVELFEPV